MIGYKVIYLLLFINTIRCEEKIFSDKPKEQSFMSKLTGWLFPFGQTEQKTEETHLAPQYLPPGRNCNPCNQSPWVPMASNLGHHTLINFQPPSSQYGPPVQNYLPPQNAKPIPFKKPFYAPPIGGMNPPPISGGLYHSLPINQYRPSTVPIVPSGYGPPRFAQLPLATQTHQFANNVHPPPPIPPSTNYGTPEKVEAPPPPLSTSYGTPTGLEIFNSPPSIQDHNFEHPPPPPPSDSYGSPVGIQNVDYQVRNEYLPPLEQLPSSSVNFAEPIPLPNLSRSPVLPIHNYQDFNEIHKPAEVQVVPSIQIADFLSSVEHPINIVQSPLVEVHVSQNQSSVDEADVRPGGFYGSNPRLSENPIVVDDSHASASSPNGTKTLSRNIIKDILKSESRGSFTPPSLDYTKWEPFDSTTTVLPTSMVPPTPGPSTWISPETVTKKHIQIIIPYTNSKKPQPFDAKYSTLHPVYSPPPPSKDVWGKFMEDIRLAESQKVTATAFTSTTKVYNIQDLLKGTKQYQQSGRVPFDVISLQNNIDDWTQLAYAKSLKYNNGGKSSAVKNIPDTFFTTTYSTSETSTSDYVGASSNQHENDLDSNFYTEATTTEEPSSTTVDTKKDETSVWDYKSVTISPITNEKVYVVTPQAVSTEISVEGFSMPPQVTNRNESNLPKFLVRVDPEDKSSRDKLLNETGPLTVVFSEWPHLINNLQTTNKPETLHHPLLGLMGYTPPVNATVHTITGHSKVVTVVTPASTKLRRVGK